MKAQPVYKKCRICRKNTDATGSLHFERAKWWRKSAAGGILAFGAIAVGLFACGALAIGAFSVGAAANGLYAALGDRAQGPVALGKSEAIGEVFRHIGELLPQDREQIRLLLEENTPFWLRWAAALCLLCL